MADINITTMSSKGQVVIPVEMRKDFKEGEKIIVIKHGHQLILKPADELDVAEDIEFARRTEEAWKKYERGEFKTLPMETFLQELERC